MVGSLQAFMNGLIDYAGLFPPASLDLRPAFDNFTRYRADPDHWMLGRFIIGAARLTELATALEQDGPAGADTHPFPLSVLVGGAETEKEALARLRTDCEILAGFLARCGDFARAEALETRLPAETLTGADPGRTAGFLESALPLIATSGLPPMDFFFETGGPASDDGELKAAAAGLATATGPDRTTGPRVGLKLRCGGVQAAAFPSIERVSLALTECLGHRLPLKCTAGLHHPVRHFSDTVGAWNHGFVNVFGAAVLADQLHWDPERIRQCLADESSENFAFDQDGFRWRDQFLPTADLAASRHRLAVGFGSCSFDEPREDLRALRWLA